MPYALKQRGSLYVARSAPRLVTFQSAVLSKTEADFSFSHAPEAELHTSDSNGTLEIKGTTLSFPPDSTLPPTPQVWYVLTDFLVHVDTDRHT